MNPLKCSYDEIRIVCDDFDKLRTTKHERIQIKKNLHGYLPITQHKSYWIVRFFDWVLRGAWFQSKKEADRVIELTYDFFNNNKDMLVGRSSTIGKLLLLQISDTSLREKIQTLWLDIRAKEHLKEIANEAEKIRQQSNEKAQKEATSLLNKAIESAQTVAINAKINAEKKVKEAEDNVTALENTLKEKQRKAQEEFLKVKARENQELENELTTKKTNFLNEQKYIQGQIEELKKTRALLMIPKTLLRCSDGEMAVETTLILNIEYFKNCSIFAKDIAPTLEEQKQYPNVKYFFSISDWPLYVVKGYFSLLKAENIHYYKETLFKIYCFANYLQSKSIMDACLDKLNNLSLEDSLSILTSEYILPIEDTLIVKTTQIVIENFQKLICDARFLAVHWEYLAFILKSDFLNVERESMVWDFVENWVQANKNVDQATLNIVRAQVRIEHLNVVGTDKQFPLIKRTKRIHQTLNVEHQHTNKVVDIEAEHIKEQLYKLSINYYPYNRHYEHLNLDYKLDQINVNWNIKLSTKKFIFNIHEPLKSKSFIWRGSNFYFQLENIGEGRFKLKILLEENSDFKPFNFLTNYEIFESKKTIQFGFSINESFSNNEYFRDSIFFNTKDAPSFFNSLKNKGLYEFTSKFKTNSPMISINLCMNINDLYYRI